MEQVMAMIDVEGYADNRTAPNPKFNEEECYNECNPDCEMTSLITQTQIFRMYMHDIHMWSNNKNKPICLTKDSIGI